MKLNKQNYDFFTSNLCILQFKNIFKLIIYNFAYIHHILLSLHIQIKSVYFRKKIKIIIN